MKNYYLNKNHLTMMMAILLLFLQQGPLQAMNQSVEEARITLHLHNASMEQALLAIEDKTQFKFFYQDDQIDLTSKVSINVSDNSLKTVLDELFKNSTLDYEQVNNHIILKKKSSRKLDKVLQRKTGNISNSSATASISNTFYHNSINRLSNHLLNYQGRTVSGRVSSGENDEGLPGVNVVVEGTTQGTVTDMNGVYTLNEVPDNATLVFSSVGFEQQSIQTGNRSVIDVVMQPDVQQLEELVVIGYGTQRKSDLTGAVSSVQRKEMELDVIKTPDQVLQGKVAGVNVFTGSHEPGGAMSVEVRGTASLTAGGSPLYVVDGVPLSDNVGSSALGGNGPNMNPLANLDPTMIESVEVLKGASATAIYGSRGSNGVVLITTRRGEAGQAKIDYNGSIGWGNVINKIDFISAAEHAQLHNERAELNGSPLPFTQAEIDELGEGTDWQDAIFRTAISTRHNVSVSGGNEALQYFVGGSYVNDEGIVDGSQYERYGATVNLNAKISDRFKLDQNLQFTNTYQDRVLTGRKGYGTQGDIMSYLLDISPTIPVYNDDGSYANPRNFKLGGNFDNPLVVANEYARDRWDNRLVGNIAGTFTIFEGLDAVVRVGMDLLDYQQADYDPLGSRANPNGGATFRERKRNNFLNENLLKFNQKFGVHGMH